MSQKNISLDGVCTLIGQTYVGDGIGNQIPKYTKDNVFCSERSAGSKEFSNAAQNDIKAEINLIVSRYDYCGQKKVMYNGVDYNVYRTYMREDEQIELFLNVK